MEEQITTPKYTAETTCKGVIKDLLIRFDNIYWGLTVQIFSVADVLEVAARILPAQLRLWQVWFESGMVVPSVFGARRHAAGCCVPHGAGRLQSSAETNSGVFSFLSDCAISATSAERGGNAVSQTRTKKQTKSGVRQRYTPVT